MPFPWLWRELTSWLVDCARWRALIVYCLYLPVNRQSYPISCRCVQSSWNKENFVHRWYLNILIHCTDNINIQIKPDGVQRGIVGNIVSRFETKGYKLSAMKTKMASQELLDQHYKGKMLICCMVCFDNLCSTQHF